MINLTSLQISRFDPEFTASKLFGSLFASLIVMIIYT